MQPDTITIHQSVLLLL